MKKSLVVLLVIVSILIVGIIAYLVKHRDVASIPLNGCEYNGRIYKEGESFKDIDGCNTCGCSNRQVACTLMYCEPVK